MASSEAIAGELTAFSPDTLPVMAHYAGDRASCTQSLYRILANNRSFSSFSDAINAILFIGRSRFKLESALLLKPIADTVYEVQAWSSNDVFFVGQHVSSKNIDTFSFKDAKGVYACTDARVVTSQGHPNAYNLDSNRAVIGVGLDLVGSERGFLCFFSEQALTRPFGIEDTLLLELMAEGIACMTDLQKARVQRKTEDLALFASGSIKSLEEYQALADLPEGLGISSKVVDVLKRRIGHSSLSIDNIATELNLSKRTLQRRLQQQGISFAELRDKVRFHYAIDFLVRQQVSIDRISSTLDFSDRTSFTNAFKRWTALSPSTFRKVFRDYA